MIEEEEERGGGQIGTAIWKLFIFYFDSHLTSINELKLVNKNTSNIPLPMGENN